MRSIYATKKFLGQAFLGLNDFWKRPEPAAIILPAVRTGSLQAWACLFPSTPEGLVWEGLVWPSSVKDLNDNNHLSVRTRGWLPQRRFPSTFTQVSGGSHDDGIDHLWNCKHTSTTKVEEGCWEWGGQRGGCFISNHKAGGDAGSQLPSILSGILFATLNAQERRQESCKHVLTLPRNSFRALTCLILFLSQHWYFATNTTR